MARQLDQFSRDEKDAFERMLGVLVSPITVGGSSKSRLLRSMFKATVVPAIASAFLRLTKGHGDCQLFGQIL